MKFIENMIPDNVKGSKTYKLSIPRYWHIIPDIEETAIPIKDQNEYVMWDSYRLNL